MRSSVQVLQAFSRRMTIFALANCVLGGSIAEGQSLILESPNGQDNIGSFGIALARLQDSSGDGSYDLVISAPREYTGGPRGRVYVMEGVSASPIRVLLNPLLGSSVTFGVPIASVPDLDGDGLSDLIIADPNATPPDGVGFAGRVHLYSGASGAALRTLAPPVDVFGCNFGRNVAGLGDIDADGFGDVAVGTLCQRVHVYSGASGQWLYELQSPDTGTQFGRVLAAVPDVDGDGATDIVVGDYSTPSGPGLAGSGRAYLFSGATGALLRRINSPSGEPVGFAYRVGGISDLDGDGRGEILIGAQFDRGSEMPLESGIAYVYSGATGLVLHSLISPLAEFGGQFGAGVAAIPDIDGDGRPDIVVGARAESPGDRPFSSGAVHIFSGATGTPLRVLLSPDPVENSGFGAGYLLGVPSQLSALRATIAIGVSLDQQGQGRVYVFAACRADANADGVVNSNDIAHFVTGWIATVGLPPGTLGPPGVHHGDFNGDGLVNSTDLSAFINVWIEAVVAGGCPL